MAQCDARWTIATADRLVKRGKFSRDKADLAAHFAALGVAGLVIGLPLNMDGSQSPRTQASRAFARNMADLGLPILLWDERWSNPGRYPHPDRG